MKASLIANFVLALLMTVVCGFAMIVFSDALREHEGALKTVMGGSVRTCAILFALIIAMFLTGVVLRIEFDRMIGRKKKKVAESVPVEEVTPEKLEGASRMFEDWENRP